MAKTLQIKAFGPRSKVLKSKNDRDQLHLFSRTGANRWPRKNESDLARERIGPTRYRIIFKKNPAFESVRQRAPNPPELLAKPSLSRSNASHPTREGTNVGVFVPVWLVLPRCEATNLGVFDLCHIGLP